MTIDGLQTRGVFACSCTIGPAEILVGQLWVRDPEHLGTIVSLIQSDGDSAERFAVQLPADLPDPAKNLVLSRVAV